MKNFKKAAIRLLAVCIAIALCNIPCIALGAEAVSVTAVTVVGANYTLPSTVNDKTVEWTTNAVNTSVPGSHYYTGTDSDGAAVKLTLKVMETETIFSDDISAYDAKKLTSHQALVNEKGLYLRKYAESTNEVYVEQQENNKYIVIKPQGSWLNKFAIGEAAYAGDFEVNMKLRAEFGKDVNNEILRVRLSSADGYTTDLIGGFLIKENSDKIAVAAFDGSEESLKNAIELSDIVVAKGETKDSIDWIEIKLIFDSTNKTYDVYANDSLIISGYNMNTSAAATTAVRTISFAQRITAGTDMTTYIDEVSVNKLVDAEAYKTLIYEDMEKFQADTDETAGTATRPALIRANAAATTETAGLFLNTYSDSTNDIYVTEISGNKVLYLSDQTGWLNKLVLPTPYTGAFTITADVKVNASNATANETPLHFVVSSETEELSKNDAVGGVAFRYVASSKVFNLRASVKELTGGTYAGDKINSQQTEWINVKLDFTGDGTYDIYLDDILALENQECYSGANGTGLQEKVAAIYFSNRASVGKCSAMIDNIKVTVPNTSVAGKQLLIAGDSIAAGYNSNADTRGWGMVIGERLQNITVNNNAVAGQYTKGFFENNADKLTETQNIRVNRFDELMWEANPGDILVLSFGHNERRRVTDNEYTIDDYKKYLGKFINKAKAYGVTTILATSIAEAYFDDGNVSESRDKYTAQIKDFAAAMKEYAAANNIPVIDLYAQTKSLLGTIGEGSADNYFVADKTHLLERGAKTVARYLTEGFAATPLAPYVKQGIVDGGVVMSANVSDGITIVNNNDVNYPLLKLVKAEYKGTVLDNAAITDATLEAGGTYNMSVSVSDGSTARVFLFESLGNLVPLTTSENVEN